MNKVKISAVSYTNTFPFLYGIRNSSIVDQIDLSVDYPSACAQKVISGEVDLGIIPVGALLDLPTYYIITDYCIGTLGAVDSVFIFSEKPIGEIKSLRLDHQSRSSNALARVLLKYHWKQDVQIVTEGEADAYVLIGDRTFGKKDTVPYVYDLGYYWKEFTGLPFAFAVWVANKPLDPTFIADFNAALKIGVSNPRVVLPEIPANPKFDFDYYLTSSLDYQLTTAKRQAIDKFLSLVKTLD